VDGVKVFQLVAELVRREFLPGRTMDMWGYNGCVPGPTIEIDEGNRVRVQFHNRLPEPTTVHWHGLEVPIAMDGTPAISQPLVPPGGRFTYEFTVRQHGTFFYHSHMAMQEMMGQIGLFIVHPHEPYQPAVDQDFAFVLQEWAVLPHSTIPNTMSMEFNWLTMNGRAAPATTPLIVRQGQRVAIRMVNLGMDHHPMHLHGHQFEVTGTEAGRIPESRWFAENTVLVGVAQARVIEFEAKYVGDWMLHCHLPHHMMNAMASMVGPMTQGGHGLMAGGGMEAGMGMPRQGHALSEDMGPALGRGLGLDARERQVSHLPGPNAQAHAGHGPAPAGAGATPGYPQDMWMPMDRAVAKPETRGLAPGWSGALTGMMTLVRVMPAQRYDQFVKGLARR
jgi:hypothetical protein